MFKTFRQRTTRAIDKRMAELSEEMDGAEGDELTEIEGQIEQLAKIKGMLKQPKISKEVLVEILKVAASIGALGIVIHYDKTGHVLPKALSSWIPTNRL